MVYLRGKTPAGASYLTPLASLRPLYFASLGFSLLGLLVALVVQMPWFICKINILAGLGSLAFWLEKGLNLIKEAQQCRWNRKNTPK